jgi:hypothetical protein
MRSARLSALRILSLLFLLPGLAGMIVSAAISTYYLSSMPRQPDLEEDRVVARGIHGITIYQTEEEDQRLSLIEYGSVGFFVVGLVLGVVYLEKWSTARASEEDDGSDLAGSYR